MRYLHNAVFQSHGYLSSANCHVDSRWVVKISGFALHAFRTGGYNEQVYKCFANNPVQEVLRRYRFVVTSIFCHWRTAWGRSIEFSSFLSPVTMQSLVYCDYYSGRWASLDFTVINYGQHLNYCGWQLDLSTELRKLTSTVLLSFYRRSCSERSRTLWTSTLHSVRAWQCTTVSFYSINSLR